MRTPLCPFPPAHLRIAHDASEHAHNLSAWQQDYSQFSPGPFEGRLTERCLPRLQVFLESANRALRQSCIAWRDAVWFGLPQRHTGELRLNGSVIADHTMMLRPGGREFELHTPAGFSILGIVIGKELLDTYLDRVEGLDPVSIQRPATLQLPAMQYDQLCQTLTLALATPLLATNGSPGADLHDRILNALGSALALGIPQARHPHALRLEQSRRLVHTACALALASEDDVPSIADLCRQLQVSRRTLQYAFHEVTSLAPLAYLRTLRLNRVRQQLRGASDARTRITRVATDFGFTHLGQFSRDYRRLFGETPSTTLRSAALAHDAIIH